MAFKIVRNDITKMQVDAIVNTANEAPTFGTGVDKAIYMAAGMEELLKARQEIGFLDEGEVAWTLAFNLSAKYILHAVSPLYIDGKSGEEEKLRACYQRSLQIAHEKGCESIAFPLVATGGFGYPKEEGMRIAVDEISRFLLKHEMLIYLVVFDTKATELALRLQPALDAYIDHHYVCEKREEEYGDRYFGSVPKGAPGYDAYRMRREAVEEKVNLEAPIVRSRHSRMRPMPALRQESISLEKIEIQECSACLDDDYFDALEETSLALKERMQHMTDTFQQYLFYLIQSKNLTNVDVYKRAIVTKKLFSKIKNNPDYHPDKATAMRLCVGAKLNLDETKDLLARAGYALSPCDKRDIIFSFFIERNIFDMIEIDIALEEHGLPCFIV